MHCVEEASSLLVALGEHNIKADIENHRAKKIAVERVIKRSDYDTNSVNNDIALLRLAEDVEMTSNIVPACLPSSSSQQYAGWQALVSGWGTTSTGGATSDVLKETSQTILANTAAECVQGAGGPGSTAAVPGTKLCAYKQGTDSCQGDSGGPLVVMEAGRWTVVGVVSYGFGCATTGFAGVYARVTNYLSWIQENIADGWCDTGSSIKFPTATTSPVQQCEWDPSNMQWRFLQGHRRQLSMLNIQLSLWKESAKRRPCCNHNFYNNHINNNYQDCWPHLLPTLRPLSCSRFSDANLSHWPLQCLGWSYLESGPSSGRHGNWTRLPNRLSIHRPLPASRPVWPFWKIVRTLRNVTLHFYADLRSYRNDWCYISKTKLC